MFDFDFRFPDLPHIAPQHNLPRLKLYIRKVVSVLSNKDKHKSWKWLGVRPTQAQFVITKIRFRAKSFALSRSSELIKSVTHQKEPNGSKHGIQSDSDAQTCYGNNAKNTRDNAKISRELIKDSLQHDEAENKKTE
jgi:hypothetical protein